MLKARPRPPGYLLAIMMPLTGCGWEVRAAEPVAVTVEVPARFPAPEPGIRDCQLMVRARQALRQDPELAPFALGVSIHGGKAALWGAVPSQALAQRALAHVSQVQGVFEVRNDLHVAPPEDPTAEFLKEAVVQWQKRKAEQTLTFGHAAPAALMSRPAEPPRPTPSTSAKVVTLMAPVPVPDAPEAAKTPSVLLRPILTDVDAGLARVVEQLRRREERYRHVQSEVRGGAVHLRGTVARGEDLMDLAWAISYLSGVQRVIVDEVRIASAPFRAAEPQRP